MRRFLATCSVVLLAVAAFGACGSSSKTVSGSSNTTTSSGGSGSSVNSDISKLYSDAEKQAFKITFTSDSGDVVTYAQDGHGKSFYGSGDSKTYISSDGTVSCNTDSNGKATCTSVSVGSNFNPYLSLYTAGKTFVTALNKYGDASTDTIAGRDADCVTFSAKSIADSAPVAIAAIASSLKGSAMYCVDKELGVLLKYELKDADGKTTSSYTVTKFEQPTDADFTPPATPKPRVSVSVPKVSIPTITYPPGYTGPTIPGNG